MEFEDIARLVNQAALETKGRPLKDVERLVFKGAWENQTYSTMAKQSVGYSEDYLKKDVGPKLWQLLSDLVSANQQGLKVTKRNLQNVLQIWASQDQAKVFANPFEGAPSAPPTELSTGVGVRSDAQPRVRELPWLDSSDFYGRAAELDLLTEWIQGSDTPAGPRQSCRLILLWGLPGVGKTALAAQLVDRLRAYFDWCGYLELPDHPTDDMVLEALTNGLAPQDHTWHRTVPGLDWVIDQLNQRRSLLVLDRLETLFTPHQLAGTYCPNTQSIQQLLLKLATAHHRSCVLVISREKPADVSQWIGSRMREYQLKDLGLEEASAFLQHQGLNQASLADWANLIKCYGSSPLLLRSLAITVKTVYQGQVQPFLAQPRLTLPDPVSRCLRSVLNRLSREEQGLLYWLALAQEPVSLAYLSQTMQPYPGAEVVQSLLGRSLCLVTGVESVESHSEQDSTRLDLLPLVRSLAQDQLIELLLNELITEQLHWFNRLPLVTMTASEVVQERQRVAVLQPLVERLQQQFPSEAKLTYKGQQWHQTLRQTTLGQPGYGTGNFLHLCHHLNLSVSGADFSELAIWQADLRPISLQGANLSQVQFRDTVFATALGRSPVAAISPQGQFMATGDHEGRLLLWELPLGRLVQVLHDGASQAIHALAFSPDGATLAVGTSTGQVWLWPIQENGPADALFDHLAIVCTLAFSPDGIWLASGDDNGTLCLWELASGLCQHRWVEHQGPIHSLAFNQLGDRLVSSSEDQRTCLWDMAQLTLITGFQANPTASVRTAGFLPDPIHPQQPPIAFAAGYDDHGLTIWDVTAGRPCWLCPTDGQAFPAMTLSPDGQFLVCSRRDFSVAVWDIPSRTCRYTLPPLTSPVWMLVFSPNSEHLITGSDYTLRLWQAKTGHGLRSFLSQAHPVSALALAAGGTQLFTGHTDSYLRLWQLSSTGAIVHSPTTLTGHNGAIQAVAISPDGQWLASAATDQTINLWQSATGRCTRVLTRPATLLDFSPDSRWLASTHADLSIILWDVATGQPVEDLIGHESCPSALAFSPNSQWLVSGSRDGTMRVWPLAQPSKGRVVSGHQRQVHSLAISLASDQWVSASHDGTVRWWDFTTGQPLGQWHHPRGQWVHGVTINAVGDLLALTSDSPEIEVWSVLKNQRLYILKGHSHHIWGVLVSPDRTYLATISQDYEIRLWKLSLGSCQQVLRPDRPYEGVNIRGATGLTRPETAMLKSLGAQVTG